MQFLGTAAADLMPGPFCKCPLCEDARRDPSRARFRSLFLLDEENLIDFGPDLGAAAMRHGADLTRIRNVFLTHTHDDHFDMTNIGLIRMSRTREGVPVEMYCSEAAYASLKRYYDLIKTVYPMLAPSGEFRQGHFLVHPVKVGETFFAGGYEVLPVMTTHRVGSGECAINYRFKKDGRSMLYACDTGRYIEESLEYLKDSRLDTLIMEGTWADCTTKSVESHLNAYAFVEQLDVFARYGIIRPDTAVYCTHINHKHEWTQEVYQDFFDRSTPYRVRVACDGMRVDF